MKKYWKHLKVITKHKFYVMQECFKRGLYWQGLIHDLSKYSPIEFFTSARYFQGDQTPIGIEKAKNGYSIAWLNHKAKNKHHYEYWIDLCDGELLLCPIPDKYIVEMFCDMIGASKAYLKKDFKKCEPYFYFKKNEKNFVMHLPSKKKLKKLLQDYAYGV